MLKLPYFQSDDRILSQLQTTWQAILNPVISNPTANPVILKNVSLSTGDNVINHRLGRNLQGWSTARIRAAATLYDTQDTNQTPQLTLNLTTDADVVVDLLVW